MRSYVPKARKAKRELRIRTREKEKGVKRPQDSQKLFMFPFLQTLEQKSTCNVIKLKKLRKKNIRFCLQPPVLESFLLWKIKQNKFQYQKKKNVELSIQALYFLTITNN